MPTRRHLLASLALLLAAPFRWVTRMTQDTPGQGAAHPLRRFELADLKRALARGGRPYHEFLDEPTMSMGLYRLPAGGEDGQSPHELDEAYYVLEGRAGFRVEDRTIEVAPGDVLFVRRHAEHRFVDIEQDLLLLVFFTKEKAERGKATERRSDGG